MSIAEGFFSIQMLWLFPLVGYLITRNGYVTGYAVCAAMSLLAAGLFIGSQRLAGLDQAAEATAATA